MKRPTHKELTNKLREALAFVHDGRVQLINQAALAVDALELDYLIDSEILGVLLELIETTKPENYNGSRPPKRSYEEEISGLALFAFVVKIDRFSIPVYFKFSIAENVFWLVSLHKNRIK